MATPGRPTREEIQRLVARVLDEVLREGGGAGAAGGEAPGPVSGPGEIAVGADHGGFALKEKLAARLREQGYRVHDCGTDGPAAVDYPDFAHAVARLVADGRCRWGVIVDGAGIGSAMVANKVPGVRASLCYDLSSARNSREHNHANVLTLGAGLIGEELARQIVDTWLASPWGSGRHARRVEMIGTIERRYLRAAGETEPAGWPAKRLS